MAYRRYVGLLINTNWQCVRCTAVQTVADTQYQVPYMDIVKYHNQVHYLWLLHVSLLRVPRQNRKLFTQYLKNISILFFNSLWLSLVL